MQFPPGLIDRFKPVRLLASGGFGSVWLAHQRALDRQVAVKTLHAELVGDADLVSRFHDEARLTASITHPGVVTLLDFGVSNNLPWMAFEYVEGRSLRTWVEKGPAPWRDVVEVARQVALALEEARRCGVVHRDIKPDNILQCEAGRYKVADFGIAKWAGGSVQTQDGVIMGTPAYISPLQVKGLAPAHQSDLYALGITMFELLTGHPPFQDDNPLLVLERHLTVPAPSVRTLVSEVPPFVDRIVARLLAKDREGRFDTAADLARELAAIPPEARERSQPTAPAGNRRASKAPAAPKVGSRRFAVAVLTALAVLAALALTLVRERPVPVAMTSVAPPSQAPAGDLAQIARLLVAADRMLSEAERLRSAAPREQDIHPQLVEVFEATLVDVQKLVDAYASLVEEARKRSGAPHDALLVIERAGFSILEAVHRMSVVTGLAPVFGVELHGYAGVRGALVRLKTQLDVRAVDPHAHLTATSLGPQVKALMAAVPWRTSEVIAAASMDAARELGDRLAAEGKPHSPHTLVEQAHLIDRALHEWWTLRRKDDSGWSVAMRPSREPERDARRRLLALVPVAVELDPIDVPEASIERLYADLTRSAVLLAEDPLPDRDTRILALRAVERLILRRTALRAPGGAASEAVRIAIPRLRAAARDVRVEVLDGPALALAERQHAQRSTVPR